MLEDRLLVWKLKGGDKESLRKIYEKYKDDVLTTAAVLLNQPSEAEEVLHDVFLIFARGIGEFQLYESLKNCLMTYTVNEVRDRMRKKMYEVVGLDSTGPIRSDSDEPEQAVIEGEESEVLADVLAQLPLQQREVIMLHLQGGMRFRQIADVQGVSINTVESRYRYGLDTLRSLWIGKMIG